jgi:DNA-binding YbaB/EbfC family protein
VFKGIGNLASLLKSAQGIGGRFNELTEELKSRRATGASGGGMIEVDVNGLGHVLAVRIDPTLVENNEREMIQDLLVAAINDAGEKSRAMNLEAVKGLTGGLSIPGWDAALNQLQGMTGGAGSTDDEPADESNGGSASSA